MSDNNKNLYQMEYTAPEEPPASRKPPVTTTGIIGWLRKNLFSSIGNSILTIVTVLLLGWFLVNMFSWMLFNAEWNVVTSNLRLLMVGQYEPDELWRVGLVGLLVLGLSGLGLGFWSSAVRPLLVTSAIVVFIAFVVPWTSAIFENPPIRLIAGADTQQSPLMFVADEGQSIQVQVERITNEEATAPEPLRAGYIESTLGATSSRIIWNDDVKSQVQRDRLDLSPYDLTLNVRVSDRDGNVIESMQSTPDDVATAFSFDVPADDWYILEVMQGADSSVGYAWVRLDGVETLDTRPASIAEREEEYGVQPSYDCPTSAECVLTPARRNMRFEGSRTLGEYFKIQLTPLLNEISMPILLSVIVLGATFALGTGLRTQFDGDAQMWINRGMLILWVGVFPVIWVILRGFEGNNSLPLVPTSTWGGLLLTIVLTFVSIIASFPISILLALGRRSDLPVVSLVCTAFIEVLRGVPLITILFFARFIVPFFSDALVNVENVIRMMIGLTLFTAAYQAEVIRGGLQVIPSGQREAAQALGLSQFYTMVFIIMPQALRAVIPALMSQFVSLFKDTTLVSLVGLFELLGIVDFIVNGQQANRAFQQEAYIFVGIIYFIIAYMMSQLSRRLEESGAGATRN
jgi:His/Glu/Gln/Arg/opine family amino acid ABC transporter permease subunit